MGFIEDQQLVETFFTDGTNSVFGVGIGIGCANGRTDECDLFGCENGVEPRRELAVAIVDQKAQGWLAFLNVPNELPCLLHDPSASGMGGITRTVDTSCAKFNEEEHVERLEKQRFDGKEITGKKLMLVVGDETAPIERGAALWAERNSMTFEDVRNGLVANVQTKLQKFSSNLAIPPIIRLGQLKH